MSGQGRNHAKAKPTGGESMKYLLHFTVLVDVDKEEKIAEQNSKILAQFKPELGAMIAHNTEFLRPPPRPEE